MTQHELALRAGLSARAVRDLERGRVRRPRRDSVRRLAEAVGLDPGEAARSAAADPSPQRAGAARLDLGVLGPLTVHRAGKPVDVGSTNLLGLLALQANLPLRFAEIVDVLWGEYPPATCRNLIHGHVALLRKVLTAPRAGVAPARTIAGVAGGYRLTVETDQLDLLRFVELTDRAHEAQAGDPEAALALYARALECWRGPVLADLPAELRQHPAAVAVSRRRLAAGLAHADLAIGLGRYQGAAEQLLGLVAEEPLHEGLHARLMVALAGSGARAAALALFTEVRDRLVEELGVEPGPELRDAQARVLRGDVPLIRPDSPRAATGGADPAPGPAQPQWRIPERGPLPGGDSALHRRATASHQAGWSDGEATALGTLGMAYWWTGHLQRAADHHCAALALHRRTGRRGGEANALLNLCLVYRDLGRLQEAVDLQARALDLHRQVGARDGEAHSLSLGEVEHDLGRLDSAQQHLSRALVLHRELGDRFGQAYVMCVLAAVHCATGRRPHALELAQDALSLGGEIGHRSTEAKIRNTLGDIHLCLGHHQEATDQYEQAWTWRVGPPPVPQRSARSTARRVGFPRDKCAGHGGSDASSSARSGRGACQASRHPSPIVFGRASALDRESPR